MSRNHVAVIWWHGHAKPTVTPLLTEAAATNIATCAKRLSSVADTLAATWSDACAMLEAEEKERAS